jgi:transposase
VFLKKSTRKADGRTYLSIVEGFRDEGGVTRTKTVRSLGYLDVLKDDYPDPVAHFTKLAAEMAAEARQAAEPTTISFHPAERMRADGEERKNLGFCALSKIYHELGLADFFKNRQRRRAFELSADQVMRLLVFDRILSPGSKRAAHQSRGRYFDSFNLSLDDVYSSLSHVASLKDALLAHLDGKVSEAYGRSAELFYYDVTNYYFEVDRPDTDEKRGVQRKKGVSKEHRPSPIVQMGLLMDSNALPVGYDLFSGNVHDAQTLLPVLANSRTGPGADRMVIVADRGLCTGDNIAAALGKGDGYVFSHTVRGAPARLKEWVASDDGYHADGSEKGFRIKSRMATRRITVTAREKDKKQPRKTKQVEITEMQVAYYSPKYAARAREERADAVAKAQAMVASPPKLKAMIERTAAKYVEGLTVSSDGEILEAEEVLRFNEERLAAEERLDGFYLICTSEVGMTAAEVIDAYRGLWRIEETFKVTKSDLSARPVYLSREDRIAAHFLVCFIALLILRILQLRTGWKHSAAAIAKTLGQASGVLEGENWYLFDHYDYVLEDIGQACGIDFSKRRLSKGSIRRLVGSTKKAR